MSMIMIARLPRENLDVANQKMTVAFVADKPQNNQSYMRESGSNMLTLGMRDAGVKLVKCLTIIRGWRKQERKFLEQILPEFCQHNVSEIMVLPRSQLEGRKGNNDH